jgi:hypothetical protein
VAPSCWLPCADSGAPAAPPSCILSRVSSSSAGIGFSAQLLLEPRGQIARGIEPARLQKLVPGRDFDEDRQVPPRAPPACGSRAPSPRRARRRFFQPESIVLAIGIPALQPHHQFDALRRLSSMRHRTSRGC